MESEFFNNQKKITQKVSSAFCENSGVNLKSGNTIVVDLNIFDSRDFVWYSENIFYLKVDGQNFCDLI